MRPYERRLQLLARAILFRTDTPFPKITAKLVAPNGGEQKIEISGRRAAGRGGWHPPDNAPALSLAAGLRRRRQAR